MFKKIVKCYDYKFIVALIVLSLIGLVMVYSASMVTAVSRYGVEGLFLSKAKTCSYSRLSSFSVFLLLFPIKFIEKKVLKILLVTVITLLALVLILAIPPGMHKVGLYWGRLEYNH
ncbi:FtsW/RodA/SpoVE family cell cycle protein [Bacillus megaterium NBRC 15308 = ATCC 14581]|nr:FtsW/RodA/SpoVE family cell cycle protein [Priestia megaterium NBRC 15308 = ATCC 14581]